MDDLEITRLCARALWPGMLDSDFLVYERIAYLQKSNAAWVPYSPLTDRAQALELVERLRLDIYPFGAEHEKRWAVSIFDKTLRDFFAATDPNLLRAICLCAARVQQAREAK